MESRDKSFIILEINDLVCQENEFDVRSSFRDFLSRPQKMANIKAAVVLYITNSAWQRQPDVAKHVPQARTTICLAVFSERRYSSSARQSKEKPAIVSAAPELSHRLMSGPPPLIRGSRELLLNRRGLGLPITVFKWAKRRDKRQLLSRLSLNARGGKIGTHTHKG